MGDQRSFVEELNALIAIANDRNLPDAAAALRVKVDTIRGRRIDLLALLTVMFRRKRVRTQLRLLIGPATDRGLNDAAGYLRRRCHEAA
jgi:hypothetical protein